MRNNILNTLRKAARSRASIRQRLFWLLGGMSLATLLVVNLIWLPGTIHDIRETHEELQRVAVQGIRDQIGFFLEEKEQALRSQAMLSGPAFLAGDQVTLRQLAHRFFQRIRPSLRSASSMPRGGNSLECLVYSPSPTEISVIARPQSSFRRGGCKRCPGVR